MKIIRLGQMLLIACVCHATSPALAQSSNSESSTFSPPTSAVPPNASSKPSSAPATSDRELSKRVRRALARSGMVMVDVTVRSHNGAITLIGSVPTDALVKQAESVSEAVDGVTSVENRLIVRIDPRLLSGQSAGTGIPAKPLTSGRKADSVQ